MNNYSAMITLFLLINILAVCVQCTEVTYIQPERFIRCSPEDDPCRITLTVSEMQTINAYCVNADGGRGESSVPVTVNEEGRFDFVYGEDSVNSCGPDTTSLFQPIVADGTTRRNLLVINDQLPGPILIGYKNQRVLITVINDLGKEAITLHWHGQHVNGSQFMDGVPFVTQCPIQPGDRFVYDFYFFPAGTYWYHSHQYDERSNGMYGALIVLDPDAPTDPGYMDLPEQHTIAFFEWFPVNSDDWIEAPFTLPDPLNPSMPYSSISIVDGTEAGFPPFYAGLMNSRGWRYTPDANDCRRSANTTLPTFNVTRSSSYRFRLVGSQVNYAYRFSISRHRLRVIATDGIDATVPSSITDLVDFIIVHVGERYDFVLEANQTVDNHLMIAETLEDPVVLNQRGYCIKAHRVYGVLHYEGASDILPDDFDDSYDPLTRCNPPAEQCFALNCPFENYPSSFNIQCISVVNLQLSTPEPVPSTDVNPSAFFNFGFAAGPSINDRVFEIPASPLLSQEGDIPLFQFCYSGELSLIPDTEQIILPCIHTYNTDTETVELVYTNLGRGGTAHPIHLHGHHYFVMNIGYPTYYPNGTIDDRNPDITCDSQCNSNQIWTDGNPPLSLCEATNTCVMKDTVIVPAGGYVRVRFPRNNWGWWIMHCHIEPHLLGGMAMVVNETSGTGFIPVPNGFPTCGDFSSVSLTTGEPALSDNTTPSSNPAEAPVSCGTPPSGPLVNPTDEVPYRTLTIILGAISAALFIMLIVVLVCCLYFMCKSVSFHKKPSGDSMSGGHDVGEKEEDSTSGGSGSGKKEEVEMAEL